MENQFFFGDENGEYLEDDSIYSEGAREQLLEDDELSPMEAGFMKGYDESYV